MLTHSDLRAIATARSEAGIPLSKGRLLAAADELGIREYSGDRGHVPAPRYINGTERPPSSVGLTSAEARVMNAYYRGEFDPQEDF
jgi:hypothetical protein